MTVLLNKPFAPRAKFCWLAIGIAMLMHLPTRGDETKLQSQVLGYQQCIDCHELPAAAWMRSSHAQHSLAMLNSNSRAVRYATRLGIEPAMLSHGSSVCTDCHATRQDTGGGVVRVMHGVSCESCHGPAGASSTSAGWYALHSGEELLPDDAEADLESALREAGMAGTEDLYSLAVRCYACHSVSNEDIVRAGHTAGTSEFELTSWFSGEVRHNFAPYTVDVEDEESNALASTVWLARHERADPRARRRLMYVVGQLADLEVNLRNRARATREGTFATTAASRLVAAQSRLQQVARQVDDAELKAAIEAAEEVRALVFLPPNRTDQPALLAAADRVAQAARAFAQRRDGSQLAAIEPLLPSEAKGEAFQP